MSLTDKGAAELEWKKQSLLEKRHREDMDALTVKVLVVLNGGGSITLLTFASNVMGNNEALQNAAFLGILAFVIGLVSATLFSMFRRKCSQHYDDPKVTCPGKTFACQASPACKISSLVFFILGALWVPIVPLFLVCVVDLPWIPCC